MLDLLKSCYKSIGALLSARSPGFERAGAVRPQNVALRFLFVWHWPHFFFPTLTSLGYARHVPLGKLLRLRPPLAPLPPFSFINTGRWAKN